MRSRKRKKIDFSKKFLVGMVVYFLLLTIIMIIIYCVKGAMPTELYVSHIPTIIAEFFILYKLEIDKRKAITSKDV